MICAFVLPCLCRPIYLSALPRNSKIFRTPTTMVLLATCQKGIGRPPAPSTHIAEIAMQEEMRRVETVVAERCAQNWREQPVFSKPVGFVPGGRKVRTTDFHHSD